MCSLFLQDTLSTFHCFHASDLIEFLQRRPDIHFAPMDLIFHEVFETCFSDIPLPLFWNDGFLT